MAKIQEEMRYLFVERSLLLFKVGLCLYCAFYYYPSYDQGVSYAGLTYHSVHPGSFPGDLAIVVGGPFWKTIYFHITSLLGDITLDERVLLLVYAIVSLTILHGIDRITSLLSNNEIVIRVIVLLTSLVTCHFLDYEPNPLQPLFLRASWAAAPIAIWLVYFALARKSYLIQILFSIFLMLMSIKIAWAPILGVIIVYAVRGEMIRKIVIIIMLLVVFLSTILVYNQFIKTDDISNTALWEAIGARENTESNPFDSINGPIIAKYGGILNVSTFWILWLIAFLVPVPNQQSRKMLRGFLLLPVVLWLFGGIYISYAPNFLKVPELIAFAPVRSLWLPQLIMIQVVTIVGISWASRLQGWLRWVCTLVIIIGLLFLEAIYSLKWQLRVIESTGIVLFISFVLWFVSNPLRKGSAPLTYEYKKDIVEWFNSKYKRIIVSLVAVPIFFTTFSTSTSERLPAMKTVIKEGTYPLAFHYHWKNVAKYLEENIAPESVIMALRESPNGSLKPGIYLKNILGMAMPFMDCTSDYFDLKHHQAANKSGVKIAHVINLLGNADYFQAAKVMKTISPKPNYLIIPHNGHESLKEEHRGYEVIAEVDGYLIVRLT